MILAKTGVRHDTLPRRAKLQQTSRLPRLNASFREYAIARESIDFLIFCTQTPDYFLPSSSCVIQERLGLPRSCGAVDVNQGCSGFVYCLSLAKDNQGQARRVLILTADTYSKLIHPMTM